MHLHLHPLTLTLSLLALLSTSNIATATNPPANPPTTPYVISALARWELQKLAANNDSLVVSPTPPSSKRTLPLAPRNSPPALRYQVPDTQTTLFIRFGANLIAQAAVELTIAGVHSVMDGLIADPTVGDQQLPAEAEPFYLNPGDGVLGAAAAGAYMILQSKPPNHLTFGIIESAMQGLWDNLIGGGRFVACTFEIWDGVWGHVGDGSLVST